MSAFFHHPRKDWVCEKRRSKQAFCHYQWHMGWVFSNLRSMLVSSHRRSHMDWVFVHHPNQECGHHLPEHTGWVCARELWIALGLHNWDCMVCRGESGNHPVLTKASVETAHPITVKPTTCGATSSCRS